MNRMEGIVMHRTLIVLLTLASAVTAATAQPAGPDWVPALITADEAAEGFYPLFNGKDLDGWWIRGEDKDAFQANDGIIAVVPADEGDWLFTDALFENFVLRYEYRCVDGNGNSGVAIRAAKEGEAAFSGMEIQVLKPGWETDWQRAGAIYATVPPAVEADNPMGEWNAVEVLCDGDRIRTVMNGRELYDISIADYTPESVAGSDWQKPLTGRVREGHIALQNHGDRVEFRALRVKPLPGGEGWRPLFNGRDLEGWRTQGDAQWTVQDGILTVNGEGMTERAALRTLEEFDDFELRLSARIHPGSNSGVFFRCAGDDPWPRSYEAQIDNRDPRQFTGAIWDQTPASELRSMDDCWFMMHITAVGPRVTVAVNGKVVVDYESQRHEAFPKGWISLQGHDPKSVVDFKDIEIREPKTDLHAAHRLDGGPAIPVTIAKDSPLPQRLRALAGALSTSVFHPLTVGVEGIDRADGLTLARVDLRDGSSDAGKPVTWGERHFATPEDGVAASNCLATTFVQANWRGPWVDGAVFSYRSGPIPGAWQGAVLREPVYRADVRRERL
jgi:hypothetical protein